MNTSLPENLRRARAQKELTLSELARAVGTKRQNLWSWESGRTSPSLEMLLALAAALGVTVDDLLRPPAPLTPT